MVVSVVVRRSSTNFRVIVVDRYRHFPTYVIIPRPNISYGYNYNTIIEFIHIRISLLAFKLDWNRARRRRVDVKQDAEGNGKWDTSAR